MPQYSCFMPLLFIAAFYFAANIYFFIDVPKSLIQRLRHPNASFCTPECAPPNSSVHFKATNTTPESASGSGGTLN
jgi:hypothetical protein